MSALGYCNLDEAFNNSTIKKKKKSRKNDIDKIEKNNKIVTL